MIVLIVFNCIILLLNTVILFGLVAMVIAMNDRNKNNWDQERRF